MLRKLRKFFLDRLEKYRKSYKAKGKLDYPYAPFELPHTLTKKTYQSKVCKQCGCGFTPTSPSQSFCSVKCRKDFDIVQAKLQRQARRESIKIVTACAHCGKTFQAKTSRQKYCSDKCCNEARNLRRSSSVEKTCPICGTRFMTRYSKKVFCSKECLNKHYSEQAKLRKQAKRKLIEKVCKQCGKSFSTSDERKFFCSRKCKSNFHQSKKFKSRTDLTCVQCGKSLTGLPNRYKFCSEKCSEIYHHGAYRKKNAATAKGVETTCPVCGKSFVKNKSNQIYCSYECKKKNTIEQAKLFSPLAKFTDTLDPEVGTDTVTVKCSVCGKPFKKFRGSFRQICSKECREKKSARIDPFFRHKPRNPNKKSLLDWQNEAAQCGLSYGQYRAAISFGKTFEELKLPEQPPKPEVEEILFERTI